MKILVSCGTFFLFTIASLVSGQPQYEVQVKLPVGYIFGTGSHNELIDGSCCSPDEQPQDGCFTPCIQNATSIRLCFRETGHSLNDTDISNCPLGRIALTPGEDPGVVTLEANATDTSTTTYSGSYQLFFQIIYSLQEVREIGSGSKVFNHSVLPSFQNDFISTLTVSTENVVLLFAGIRVVCKDGYFGSDCAQQCNTRDDSTGHFMCDLNGTKVCLPGYQDPETNCTQEAPTENSQTTAASIPTNRATTVRMPTIAAGTSAPLATASIAVGASVGGFIVLITILVIIVVTVSQCKQRKRSKNENGHVVFTAMRPSRAADRVVLEESNSDIGREDVADYPGYAKVNRNRYGFEEEPPPISPYIEPVSLRETSGALSPDGDSGYSTAKTTKLVYADLNVARPKIQIPFNTQSNFLTVNNPADEVEYARIQS